MKLELTTAEYEQITCDIEGAIDEMKELSREVDWYTTELPERLATVLEILEGAIIGVEDPKHE